MRNQKGFIQTPLLIAIIVGISVLGGVGYVGIKQYENYQVQKTKEIELARQNQDQKAAEQQVRDALIEKLKNEVDTLKNQKPQVIIKEVPKSEPSLASIVSQWRPRIAHIECQWYAPKGLVLDMLGTGVLTKTLTNIRSIIFTNRHVITDQSGNAPWTCGIKFPDDNQVYKIDVNQTTMTMDNTWVDPSFDVGEIIINNPSTYLQSNGSTINYCKNKASVGDSIVILGYPGIGSQTDITATEGIISGYDGNYYITSAKVEHGNSGGAAILLKNNCYLGVPSFVNQGELESLARVLDFNFYYNKTFSGN